MELLILEVDLPMRMKSQREDEKFFHDSICVSVSCEFVLSFHVNWLDWLHGVLFISPTIKNYF